jgi:uncharacterized LabA/DUF88 family protein
MPLRANIYIDGFNFYYGCLKGTKYKWLDFSKLCQFLLPKNTVGNIRYFTAQVVPRSHDPQQGQRQQTYLRALRTIPNLSIIEGHFSVKNVRMMKADGSGAVTVIKTEEKGSDVNLASYVLTDAYDGLYDVAVIISNDSDLAYPLSYIRQRLGKVVGLLNPHQHPSQVLMRHKDFYKPIRPSVLAASQFPDQMTDSAGVFHCPSSWR